MPRVGQKPLSRADQRTVEAESANQKQGSPNIFNNVSGAHGGGETHVASGNARLWTVALLAGYGMNCGFSCFAKAGSLPEYHLHGVPTSHVERNHLHELMISAGRP